MSAYDPASGITYGEYLRRKGIQVHGGRSTPRRRESLDEHGHRRREVTELTPSGAISITTNRSDERGDHQDVHIHAPVVTVGTAVGA